MTDTGLTAPFHRVSVLDDKSADPVSGDRAGGLVVDNLYVYIANGTEVRIVSVDTPSKVIATISTKRIWNLMESKVPHEFSILGDPQWNVSLLDPMHPVLKPYSQPTPTSAQTSPYNADQVSSSGSSFLSDAFFISDSSGNQLSRIAAPPGFSVGWRRFVDGQNAVVAQFFKDSLPAASSALPAFHYGGAVFKKYDLTNPSQPLEVGSIEIDQPLASTAVVNSTLFVANAKGLYSINLKSSSLPMKLHNWIEPMSTPSEGDAIVVSGNYVLLYSGYKAQIYSKPNE